MNALDLILIICFLPFFVHGIMKGFIAQVTAIVSIILGVWLSFKFSDKVCQWLLPYLDVSDKVLHVISFILIMVAVVAGLYLVCRFAQGLFKIVMLGWLDKLLGVVFSLVKGMLLVGVLIILFNTLNTSFHFISEEKLSESVLYTPLKDIAYAVFPYFKELLFKQ